MSRQETINIFVIETELQFLASQEIIKKTNASKTLFFSYSESLSQKLTSRNIKHVFLDRDWSGTIQKIIKLKKCLSAVVSRIRKELPFSEIIFHTPRIDQVHQNLIIHALQRNFPSKALKLRMIPDGILNTIVESTNNTSQTSLKTRLRYLKYLPFPDLKYYYFSGCSIGIDDPLFDILYSFSGIKTNYPEEKLEYINIEIERKSKPKNKKIALIIGQRLLDLSLASAHDVTTISNRLKLEVERLNVDEVHYLGHPRSSNQEFNKGYSVIKDDIFCAEELYSKAHYSYVLGCTSTALINAKMLLDESVVISVGLDTLYRNRPDKGDALRYTFESAGIVVL
jgi:hypothetical protein